MWFWLSAFDSCGFLDRWTHFSPSSVTQNAEEKENGKEEGEMEDEDEVAPW